MAKHLDSKNNQAVKLNNLIERFPVLSASPLFEGGRFPAKIAVGEIFPVSAKIFREGHDFVSGTCVIKEKNGKTVTSHSMKQVGFEGDDDFWGLAKAPDIPGEYSIHIESWSDTYHTWEHVAWIKIPQNIDIELVFEEGARIFERWSKSANISPKDRESLNGVVTVMRDKSLTPDNRLARASSDDVHNIWEKTPFRELISISKPQPLIAQRKLSAFSSWYQFFPRSEGAKVSKNGEITPGTFSTASKRLQAVKDMGFDIIYVPPIHPVGKTHRKGPNNSLIAKDSDPGSPWAVGSADGGHDAINPDLGTLRTFKNFVKKAQDLGLEVSIDLALQCSPDHPWIKEHPNWFTTRADGTIAYAENPPKKYQDIYPINFDNDPDGIVKEVLRIVKLWIDAGVTIFRVDNPHTKPVWFWQYVIAEIKSEHPDIIWLAEAFTKPAMMKTLGLVGFDQSHSYFPWRNTKHELEEFFSAISGDDAFWFRSTLWPSTPDILTSYLASSGTAGHAIRAVLAAMGGASWGIYAGYELVENIQRANMDGTYAEEHVDSEKYQIKVRNWKDVSKYGIADLISTLNRVRNNHVACQNMHNLKIHTTNNDNIIAFSRHLSGEFTVDEKDDTLIIVVNLDPHNAQQGTVYLDWGALNLPESFNVYDEISGKEFEFGRDIYVDLAPVVDVAHIFHVRH
ncbi:MAG: DUF3416 domain-containing protein [Candidatus Ancillula sp.]|jgi:starch synthase (maltosyl-transferring)|nr:DUF3416 domain-containing protein [Candidatus Ancillula sp.]